MHVRRLEVNGEIALLREGQDANVVVVRPQRGLHLVESRAPDGEAQRDATAHARSAGARQVEESAQIVRTAQCSRVEERERRLAEHARPQGRLRRARGVVRFGEGPRGNRLAHRARLVPLEPRAHLRSQIDDRVALAIRRGRDPARRRHERPRGGARTIGLYRLGIDIVAPVNESGVRPQAAERSAQGDRERGIRPDDHGVEALELPQPQRPRADEPRRIGETL